LRKPKEGKIIMDILFFSINIIGCLVYFLFSFKSHQNKRQIEQLSNDETELQKIDNRLSQLEKQLK
jgi:uncharacterized protein YpmB